MEESREEVSRIFSGSILTFPSAMLRCVGSEGGRGRGRVCLLTCIRWSGVGGREDSEEW